MIDMTRRNNVCGSKHTPLSPRKNRIRRDWLLKVGRAWDIITISHGILDVLSILGWMGRIQICDIDPGIRKAAHYLAGLDNIPGDYPDLFILPPGKDVQSTVVQFCERYGVSNLGAVDVDLACGLRQAEPILNSVLKELLFYGFSGKVLLTISDARGASLGRDWLKWLRRRLPREVLVVDHKRYNSLWINEHAQRQNGSVMLFIELELRSFCGKRNRRPNTKSTGGQILAVLRESKKALTNQQIRDALPSCHGVTIKTALHKLWSKNLIIRKEKGIYALPLR